MNKKNSICLKYNKSLFEIEFVYYNYIYLYLYI